MILVHAPLKRDYIIELLNNQVIDGVEFKLMARDGMKLKFDHSHDVETAIQVAKKAIKSSEYGQALFFNVSEI